MTHWLAAVPSFVWLLAVGTWVAAQLGRTFLLLRRENSSLAEGIAPDADAIRAKQTIEKKGIRNYDWLISRLQLKVRSGILQEEAILSELEDRIIGQGSWFRELSAACILSALLVTFINLHSNLPAIFKHDRLSPKDLNPLLELVGANWWLLAIGLIFHAGATLQRWLNNLRFDLYRDWLECHVFPYLGVARTTADHLSNALGRFAETVKNIQEAVLPLGGLSNALDSFQQGLINEMVPALSKGLEGVRIGLSDEALHRLEQSTVESGRALREMKEQQARMLALTINAERHMTEFAGFASSIAEQTRLVAGALSEQTHHIGSINGSMVELRNTIGHSIAASEVLSRTLSGLADAANTNTAQLKQQDQNLLTLTSTLPGVHSALGEIQKLMSAVQLGLAGLAISENNLRGELQKSTATVSRSSADLSSALANSVKLKEHWQEAMLQMGSIADEITRRSSGFERASTELVSSAGAVAAQLAPMITGLEAIGTGISRLSETAVQVADGNKGLITAFGDLQTTGQKLKNLGHSVSGHFESWQEHTRKFYGRAQDSAEKIEQSFARVAGMVKDMERVISELLQALGRDAEHRVEPLYSAVQDIQAGNGFKNRPIQTQNGRPTTPAERAGGAAAGNPD